jgi:acyl carrier protein
MASVLYLSEAEFREAVDRCCELLDPILGVDLRKTAFSFSSDKNLNRGNANGSKSNGNSSARNGHHDRPMNRSNGHGIQEKGMRFSPSLAHPVVFVTEYALAHLLINWGIVPQAMMGHGVGEYVAATIANSLSLQDALRLVCVRARLIDKVALDDRLDEEELLSQVSENDSQEFAQLLRSVDAKAPGIPYISNISAKWITPEEASDPRYWSTQRHQSRRFNQGLDTVLQMKDAILLEIGRDSAFSSRINLRRDGDSKSRMVLPTLKAEHESKSDDAFLLATVANLWLSGVEIDWSSFYSREKRHRVTLPTYPFERQRYWIDISGKRCQLTATAQATTHDSGKKSNIADWFYVHGWKQSTPFISCPGAVNHPTGLRWMVLVNDNPLALRIVSELECRGEHVARVKTGKTFSMDDVNSYTINPAKKENYDLLLNELSVNGSLPNRVVDLWGVIRPEARHSRSELVNTIIDCGVRPLLHLIQALPKKNTEKTQVFVVANGMHKITGQETFIPETAILAGCCKALNQKHQSIVCRGMDIVLPQPGSTQEDDLIENLLVELTQERSDSIVAYRGDHRWMQNVEPLKLEPAADRLSRLRFGGVYLITGGLERIGLAIAQQLARTVAAKLVLIDNFELPSRTQWEPLLREDEFVEKEVSQKIWQILAMEEMGSEVLFINAEISNVEQMQGAVAQVFERFGEIHGVFHASGVSGVADSGAEAEGPEINILTTRVMGLIVLEDVVKNIPLDFLLLMSSLRSVSGGAPGGVQSCATSSYFDTFAHALCSRKRTVLSVNSEEWYWGPEEASEAQFLEQPMRPHDEREKSGIRYEEGIDALWRVLEAGLPQVVVSTQDLRVHAKNSTSSIIHPTRETVGRVSSTGLTLHPRPQLYKAYVAPTNELERKIVEIWQDLLGIDDIGIEDSFFELGGHSLSATRLFARMRKEFQISFSLRSIFELPTVASQSEMISALTWMDKDMEFQIASGNAIEGEIA